MSLRHIACAGVFLVVTACSTNEAEPSGSITSTDVTAPIDTSTPSDTDVPPTTEPIVLEQLAIWPAADVVYPSPQAAAESFITTVLGIPPNIGEFMAGDARSGEIEVFSPGDVPAVRSLLLLRQLGPRNGWFVIGTINDNALITKPVFGASIKAKDVGSVVVEGLAEGFEASLTVYAFIAGRAGDILDQETTMGGNFGVPGPFQVTLDLTGAKTGDTVVLLVRGGVGLETDPGEFGAIAIQIS